MHQDGPREVAANATGGSGGKDFYANPEDNPDGFLVNGTLPVSNNQGVHSLTDVPVFAVGPCQELFAGESTTGWIVSRLRFDTDATEQVYITTSISSSISQNALGLGARAPRRVPNVDIAFSEKKNFVFTQDSTNAHTYKQNHQNLISHKT